MDKPLKNYISSLSQYIADLEDLRKNYPTKMLGNNPAVNPFVFRGHSDSSYKLLPSLFRKSKKEFENHDIENSTYLSLASEKSLLQEFIQEASSYISLPSTDLLHWAEYAQHYGVPTRFLDWSSNPLVALYFACKGGAKSNAMVWVVHKYNYDRFSFSSEMEGRTTGEIIQSLLKGQENDVPFPILYTPYYVDSRMSAQNSYFMAWGTNKSALEDMVSDNEYWMQLTRETGLPNGVRSYGTGQVKEFLYRFDIHSDRKQALLHELNVVGINEKTLFPGLDGIGRYIERQYRFDYDEVLENL